MRKCVMLDFGFKKGSCTLVIAYTLAKKLREAFNLPIFIMV